MKACAVLVDEGIKGSWSIKDIVGKHQAGSGVDASHETQEDAKAMEKGRRAAEDVVLINLHSMSNNASVVY